MAKKKKKGAPEAEGDDEADAAEASKGDEAGEGDGEGGEGAPAKKKPKLMTLLLFAGLPALVLILGGSAAAMFLLGGKSGDDHGEASADAHGAQGGHGGASAGAHGSAAYDVVFYELPEILVNIRSEDGRASYLKLKVTLEVDSEEIAHVIEPAMPRVLDRFQSFLRELRVEDLNGSMGSYRLRLELLRRVNLAVAPEQVRAVLIEEMLIQ
jgi:flagellar FliL protein